MILGYWFNLAGVLLGAALAAFGIKGHLDAMYACAVAGNVSILVGNALLGAWFLCPAPAAGAAVIGCWWWKDRRGNRKRRALAVVGTKSRALVAKLVRSLKPAPPPRLQPARGQRERPGGLAEARRVGVARRVLRRVLGRRHLAGGERMSQGTGAAWPTWHCPDCGAELDEDDHTMWCPNDECAIAYTRVQREDGGTA